MAPLRRTTFISLFTSLSLLLSPLAVRAAEDEKNYGPVIGIGMHINAITCMPFPLNHIFYAFLQILGEYFVKVSTTWPPLCSV